MENTLLSVRDRVRVRVSSESDIYYVTHLFIYVYYVTHRNTLYYILGLRRRRRRWRRRRKRRRWICITCRRYLLWIAL